MDDPIRNPEDPHGTGIKKLSPDEFPSLLKEITDPPKALYLRGILPSEDYKVLCVVGSRRFTSYGKQACEKLIAGLAGYPIAILSGLALGLDGIAHEAALAAGLITVGVPGSGLNWDVIHPRTNYFLARRVIEKGGALVSDYEPDFKPTIWSFPKRNRIMVGLSHAVLVIEATQKSGTMITARLASEYNRDCLAVPGSIFSVNSEGVHDLIRNGATPVRSSEDILEALDLKIQMSNDKFQSVEGLSENEKKVLKLLLEPMPRDELIRRLNISTSEANTLLSVMEIKGLISESLGTVRPR